MLYPLPQIYSDIKGKGEGRRGRKKERKGKGERKGVYSCAKPSWYALTIGKLTVKKGQ